MYKENDIIKQLLQLKGYEYNGNTTIEEVLLLPEKNMNISQIGGIKSSIDFVIEGGRELKGSVETNCSKNGAMGLLCASLLNDGQTIFRGIPRIEEVSRIIEVLASIGVNIEWIEKNTIKISNTKNIDLNGINAVSASRTRSILMFIAPLMHRFKSFKIPHSQGCTLGTRTIKPHMLGLKSLGVKINVAEDNYEITYKNNQNTDSEIIMWEASDTGTEMLLMAAAKIESTTIIKYASSNYMVQDVCFYLQKLGVKIEGIGTSTLIVKGVKEINLDLEFYNSEDPIETMMFITAAITTNSELTITRAPINFLEIELLKLKEMGLEFELSQKYLSNNGETILRDITIKKSKLNALEDKITCGAYPDLNMDNLPFFVPICSLAKGDSLIHDWVYENRAIYFTELNRLGANITLADPHRVFIKGGGKFTSAQMVCPPALRPAMIIMLGMLGASGGTSVLRNVYSIKRGYEEIATRLNSVGANIKVITN